MIDVVIPTIPGREESLGRLLDSLAENTWDDLNAIPVYDSETCGAGWKQGLEGSEAPYVLLACDDQEFTRSGWDAVAIETVDEGLLPCPRVWNSDGTIQSQGGDMEALHHVISRPQKDRTPVDYTVIPFLSRAQADAIGMVETHYASDVWVSHRGRQLGYETVLRHGFEVVHHNEAVGRGAGMSQVDRDRMDCATVAEALARCEVPA